MSWTTRLRRGAVVGFTAIAVAVAAVPAAAMVEHHHPGDRCNPHKRAPHGFKCKKRHGHYVLVRKR